MRNVVNRALEAKKKQYDSANVEILRIDSYSMMIPISDPSDPQQHLPKGHFVPGPGASYDPQGSIV